MSGADSPVLATGDAGSARALNTLAAFISNATDLDGYMMHPVVTSKLGKGIILDAAPVATEKQCKHNLTADGKEYLKMKIVEAKAVLDVACKTDDTKLQYSDKTGVYSSNVDGWLAVRAFAEIWDAYDGAAQEIKSAVTNAAGGVAKKLKSAIPFDSYGETIEKPIGASMRASTLTFGDWLKDSVDLPLTAKLVKEVESNLGLTDEICTFKRAHLLRYPTKVGSLFKMHTDYGDFPTGQAPHITANVLISPSQVAEMQVAGFDESFKYTMPGSVGAFPSGLYHSSGRCDGRKVLLVLMWRLNAEKPAEKSDSVDLTEPSSSTEAAQASTVEVKPIIKPEPATTTGSAAVPPAEPPVAEPIAPPATVTPVTAAVDKPVLQPDLQAEKPEVASEPAAPVVDAPIASLKPASVTDGSAAEEMAVKTPKADAAIDPDTASSDPVETSPQRATRSDGGKGAGPTGDLDKGKTPAAAPAPAGAPAPASSKRDAAEGDLKVVAIKAKKPKRS